MSSHDTLSSLRIQLAPSCPWLLSLSLPLALIGCSESGATWNTPCPKQRCWFIRKPSSCRHSWCLETLSAVSGSAVADRLLFRRQQPYLCSHTKSSVQLLLAGVGLWEAFCQAQRVSAALLPTAQHSQSTLHHPHPHFKNISPRSSKCLF